MNNKKNHSYHNYICDLKKEIRNKSWIFLRIRSRIYNTGRKFIDYLIVNLKRFSFIDKAIGVYQ